MEGNLERNIVKKERNFELLGGNYFLTMETLLQRSSMWANELIIGVSNSKGLMWFNTSKMLLFSQYKTKMNIPMVKK